MEGPRNLSYKKIIKDENDLMTLKRVQIGENRQEKEVRRSKGFVVGEREKSFTTSMFRRDTSSKNAF